MDEKTKPTLVGLSHQIDGISDRIDEHSHQIEEVKQEVSQLKVTPDEKSLFINKSDFLLHEYDALKSEVVQRIVTRYSIISIALVALGAVFTIQNKYLDLLFPFISLALLIVYISNAHTIRNIGNYIKDNIEDQVSENGIEAINKEDEDQKATKSGHTPEIDGDVQSSTAQEQRVQDRFGWQNIQATKHNIRQVGFSAGRMTFVVISLVAIITGIILIPTTHPSPGVLVLDIILSLLSIIIFLITLSIGFTADRLLDYIKDEPLTPDNGSQYVFKLLQQVIKNLSIVFKSLGADAGPAKDNTPASQ